MNSTLTAMEYMSKDKNGHGGSIVQIASIAGICPFFVCPIYSATKFAVVGFSRCLGVSLIYIFFKYTTNYNPLYSFFV